MRTKLIVVSALFALVGVVADQLAFHTDNKVSSTQQNREWQIENLQLSGAVLVENNLLNQKMLFHLEKGERLPGSLWKTVKYDVAYLCDYALENSEWMENPDFAGIVPLDSSYLASICHEAAELMANEGQTIEQQERIRVILGEITNGLLIDLINVDLEIFWLLQEEIEAERNRQIFLLAAIASSLFSILAVLVFFRIGFASNKPD